METRKRVTQPVQSDDGIGDFFGVKQGKKPITTDASIKTSSPDGIGDFLQKKNIGGTESSNGSTPSDTSVSESISPIQEQKQSSTNSPVNPTAFNSLTLTPDQLQNLFDAPKHFNDNPNQTISPAEFLTKDIDTHAPNIFNNVAKSTGQAMPFADKMSAFDKEQIAKTTKLNVLNNPEAMAGYTKQRVDDLRKGIQKLETEKLKYVSIDSEQGIKNITNEDAYNKTNVKIVEKQNYINSLKNNIAEIAADKIISNVNLSSFDPKDIGRKIIEIADPELHQQFQIAEKGGNLPGVRRTDLERLGLNAAKAYIDKNPDLPNAKEAMTFIHDMESDFDERNFQSTAARVRNKLGEYFYNESKSGVFGYSQDNLLKAINDPKLGLTSSEKKIAETVVLPTEKKIFGFGTDIPGSGFARSFRSAVEKSSVGTVNSVLDLVGARSDAEMANENLDYAKTRYNPIEARGKWSEFKDGMGDLTGQVAMMAATTKGVGSFGKVLSASALEGGLLGGMTRGFVGQALQNENVGLFLNSYFNSYDNYKQQALQLMPGENQSSAREGYASSMAVIEGLSEKIFNDTKILKAFSKELSPSVRDITSRYISNEITGEIARREMGSVISKTIKPFAKEFLKAEIQEPTEESVVDIADGAAKAIFGGTSLDVATTGKKALNTFLTTALYSPLVSGLAAHGHINANKSESAFYKSTVAQMAANPGEYLAHVDDLLESGEITSQQANEKRKLINSSSKILNELPASRIVEPINENDVANNVSFTPAETSLFVLHGLNQQILQQKIDDSQSPAIVADLKKQLNRSANIQKGIYDGSITINDNLQEVAQDPKEAEKLNIINPETIPLAVQVDQSELTVKEPSAPIIKGKPESISQPIELSTNEDLKTTFVNPDEISKPIELSPDTPETIRDKEIQNLNPGLANDIKIPETQPYATVNNDTKEFFTKSRKQKVVRENGKLSVLNEDNTEASPQMEQKALREYSHAYDYTTGEKAASPSENDIYANESELKADMVTKSSSPSELAAIYADESHVSESLSEADKIISDFGIKTTEESYRRFGDKNKKSGATAKAYFSKTGTGLDVQAKEMSDHAGFEITPEDLIYFMDKFPNGIYQAGQTNLNSIATDAADKFYRLTGLHLTPEIAELAIDQEGSKFDFINNQLLKDSYESERSLTDAYFDQIQNNPPVAPTSESKNVAASGEVGKLNNETKPTITEAGKTLADKLRKLKSSQAQANANIFGLAVGVYDGVIETIATAIENGAILADAIKTGIDSLSSKDRKNLNEAEFIKHIEDFAEGKKPKLKIGLTSADSETVKPNSSKESDSKKPLTDQRRFTQQVISDKTILPEVKSQLKGNLDYVVARNAITADEAEFIMDNHTPDEVYNIVVNNEDTEGQVRVVLGQALIKKYNDLALKSIDPVERNKYIDKTVDIANFVSVKLGTEAGRIIQAFSLYDKLTKEGQLRWARQDRKSQGEKQKSKAAPEVNKLAKKIQNINEETANEIINNPEVKKSVKQTTEKKEKRVKDKIEKIRDKRAAIIKKYKQDKGKTLYAAVGLTNEGIEFVGNIAATYIQEGVANVELLIDRIKIHLQEVSGKPMGNDVELDVERIANEYFNGYVSKKEKIEESQFRRGVKYNNQTIGKLLSLSKQEQETAKKDIIESIIKRSNITGNDAVDMNMRMNAAYERIEEDYKDALAGKIYSQTGLSEKGKKFVESIADTHLEEGVKNLSDLSDKIHKSILDATGSESDNVAAFDIEGIANDKFGKYFSKSHNKSDSQILEELKKSDQKIGDIVKQHFSQVDETKRTLTQKLVDDAELEGVEAEELSKKLQDAFDRIATKKKQKLLEVEKKRFERIQNKLVGAKNVNAKQIQDEIIRYSNLGAFSDLSMMDKMSDMLGTGALSPEQAAEIERLAEKIQQSGEGSPKREATEDLLSYRENLKGNSWGEILQGIYYANVLSGYRTHLKNIVDTFFSGMGAFANEFRKDPRSLPFLMLGAARGVKIGLNEARYTAATGRSPIHVSKVETPSILERTNFFGGKFNPVNWLKYVGRILAAEDVVQFRALSEMKAYQYAYREAYRLGYKDPFAKEVWKIVDEKVLNTKDRFDAAKQQAIEEGLQGYKMRRRTSELMELNRPIQMREESYGFGALGTYNHATQGTLGAITDSFAKTLDIKVKGVRPFRLVVPFTRIITNVVNSKLDYTPLGFIRAARGVRGFEGFTDNPGIKEKYHVMTSDEKNTMIGKASMGIILTAAMYVMTKMKDKDDKPIIEITGEGPHSFSKLAELKLQGWKPYSIKIGNHYISYELTPLVFNLAMIGAMDDHEKYKTNNDETGLFEKIGVMATQGVKLIADMTWIGSTSTLLGAIANPDGGKAEKEISNILGGAAKGVLVPNAYTQLAQEYQTLNNIPQKEVKNVFDNFIQDIPIARNTLNDKINALGDPVVRNNPLIISTETKDPVWKYLLDHNGWVAPVNRNTLIFRDKEGLERPATDDEYYKFAKARGSIIKERILDIIKNGADVENEDGTESRKTGNELTPKQLQKQLRGIAKDASAQIKSDMQAIFDE